MTSLKAFPRASLGLSLLAAALCACSGSGAPPDDGDPTTPPAASTWSKSLGGPNDDWANAVIATRDGGYLLAGVLNHQQVAGAKGVDTVEGDFWVAKLDTLGDPQWQQALGERRSASGEAVVAYRRVRAAASGYWMVGTQTVAGPSGAVTNRDASVDLQVARLDESGAVSWTRSYDSGTFGNDPFFESNASAQDRGWDIAPLADGGALVVAWSSAILRANPTNGVPAAAPWVLRLSSTGEVLWQRRLSETQFEYLPEEPAELLVRAGAGNGAIVAASTRLRGADSDPTAQLTLLDGGGVVRWSQRYSRLRVHDALQAVEDDDGLPDDGIVIAGEDFGLRLLGEPTSLDDDDTIVMRLAVEDGTEDWRQVMDDGVSLNAISQQCRRRPDNDLTCFYIAVGSGKIDDEGSTMAMAVGILPEGTRFTGVFLEGMAVATDVDTVPGIPLTLDTPVVVVGHAKYDSANGTRGFRATFTPTLIELDRQFTAWSRTTSGRDFDEVILQREGQVLGEATGFEGLSLRTYASDGTPLLSREYGGASERRGERAFDAIEVSDGFIVAGQADGTGTDAEHPATLLAKLNATGGVAWQSTLSDFSLVSPRGFPYEALADGGDGGMVVAGAQGQHGDGLDLIRVARLNSSGVVSWVSVPLNPASSVAAAYPTSVQRASDGGYFVAGGLSLDEEFDAAAWITALDAQGGVRWQRLLQGGLRITGMRALPEGGAVLAGISMADGAHRPWAASVSADGNMRWTTIYSAESADADPGARITLAAGGGFLLAASHLVTDSYELPAAQAAAGRRNALLIRLNADGTARWHRTYGGLQDETIYGLDSASDGGFVVAGRSDSLGERGEAWVMRLGADGLINAGCNALLSARDGTNHAPLASQLRVFSGTGYPSEAVAGSSAAQPSGFPARAAAEVVVARQCSGVAQPDGGGTPPAGFRLTVMQGSASAPGVVTSTPAGISCGTLGNVCDALYLANTTVTLRIDPGMAGRFIGWAGCDVVDGERCLVTMTADRSVTATFRAANSPGLELTVTGNGQVTGGGLSCRAGSGVCAASYSPGEIVALTATPDATETFLGWGGSCAAFARATPIDVEMGASRSCSAQFTGAAGGAPQVSISLEPAQVGPVIGYVRSAPEGLTCGSIGSDCQQTFARGTAVRLDAVSTDANWEFESFRCAGGIQTAGARSLSFDAEQDVNCIAAFASDVERLKVKIVSDLFGGSPGRVISQGTTSPRHLDCDADCDRPFTRDTFVVLRAEADQSHAFANWSGCDSLSVDPSGALPQLCHVRMNRTRNVAAAFTAEHIGPGDNRHVLSIDFPFDSGDGSVEYNRPADLPPCTPQGGACAHTYDRTSGPTDDVVLTIRPAGNNSLVLNEGCGVFTPASGTGPATCRVTMDRDRGVTFGFSTVNAAPAAVISRTPAGAVAVNEVIDFSGAASTDDEDVSQLSFQWDFDGDSITDVTGITATHAFAQPGLYQVRLLVVDRAGSLDIAYTDVEVIAANTPPTAFFIYSPGLPLVGNSVRFDASASNDANGIATYRWDFDGNGVDDLVGDATTARVVDHTFNTFGTYTVRLRVVDILGAVGETTREVSVGLASGGATLTLNLLGNGHGVVTYVPIVTACSKDSEPVCARQFPVGTQVVLKASAYTGSSLGDWIGCTSLNANGTECTVDLSANKTVSLFIN